MMISMTGKPAYGRGMRKESKLETWGRVAGLCVDVIEGSNNNEDAKLYHL